MGITIGADYVPGQSVPKTKPPQAAFFMPARKAGSAERGYGHRWQQARVAYLRANPLCVMCRQEGRLTAASVVDHVIPHRGDAARFWDADNWQALCKVHHDGAKQSSEKGGGERGCDALGNPLSKTHHWYR